MDSNSVSTSIQEWRAIFSILDYDQDGVISETDLHHLMRALGQSPTPDQLKQITNLVGVTAKEPLPFSQFLHSFNPKNSSKDTLRQAFSAFDADRDGVINNQDLAIALTKLGESVSIQDATDLLKQWGNGPDPHFDYQKFVNVMLAGRTDWTQEATSVPFQPKKDNNISSNRESEGSAAEYVRSLQAQALQHGAVHHPYLQRLAQGQVPDIQGALKDFALQYYAYSQHFRAYLQATMAHLSAPQAQQLLENVAEESGQLDLEHQQQLQALGIDPAWVNGIPHPKLFRQFQTALGIHTSDSAPSHVEPYCDEAIAFSQQIKEVCGQSAAIAVGAIGIGTELVVQPMYRYLLQAIQSHTPLTPQDYVFFSLHSEVDDHHADVLLKIAIDLAATPAGREQLADGMAIALNARSQFWNALLTRALNMSNSSNSNSTKGVWNLNQDGATAKTLYNAQSHSWVRREPSCLSDFTARPEVFKLCAPVKGLRVLDLGCGEGYCSRALKRQGAGELIGVDVSDNMISAAQAEERRESLGIRYLQGDATDILSILHQRQFISDDEVVNGAFDLIVCVFLFNYVTLAEMETCMQQAYRLLRPGGRFVFSVPHPSFAFWDRIPAPPFYFKRQSSSLSDSDKDTAADKRPSDSTGYFTSKDQLLPGIICRKDGTELNVQVRHKSLQDYFDVLQRCGFSTMPTVKELHVTDELLAMDHDYFASLLNVPLHLAFSVQKAVPVVTPVAPQRSQEIIWSQLFNPQDYRIEVPTAVREEFKAAHDHLQAQGITWENYYPGDAGDLPHISALGLEIRKRLQETTGVALVQGFDLTAWGDTFERQEQAAKLFYLLVSQATGEVLTKRGRLYDVIDRHLDVADDNVLFSATNEASGWHTDSTDKTFFPDWVGLMSLRTSPSGGVLQVANALNVYYRLRSLLPSFIFRHLEAPIIRDLIETGLGAKSGDMWERVRRHPKINVQAERIRQNTFPIFAHDPVTHQFSFRYMRYWIESGHQRAEEPLSPLLAIAMNALDKALSDDTQIQRIEHTLQPGEIIFLNNHICPHNRTAFQDDPAHPRKMVRVWLQACLRNGMGRA